MADEGNSTVGLLNGIAKREYYGSTDITDEFLKEELFPNLSTEEFTAVYTKCSHLLKVRINFNYHRIHELKNVLSLITAYQLYHVTHMLL